ncbi:hypothetical protein C2857_000701 [Epichloe festucae Fl1]|uniref:Uncharacterized protein n=1 Tax=Epichloe festucae (strain Fl1) TaxID=877507 RepID=A0A7U3Q293_EPIFF|nr:hypothetical protein C2857_000701 [Epichloe festucae Fl1]
MALTQPAACTKWLRDADELKFHVRSTNPATNNRRLSLRPSPKDKALGFPAGTFHYVGLDDTSPQLVARMTGGALSSTTGETINHGGCINFQRGLGDGQTLQFSFFFGNIARFPPAADTDWTLKPSSGGLELHHNQPAGSKGGFALCKANFDLDSGPRYDLTYFWSDGKPAKLDGCELVTIVSTQA